MRTTRAHKAPISSFTFRVLATIVSCASFHGGAFGADAVVAAPELVIADLKGDVRLSVRGEPRAAQKGNAVDLPATIRTGRASSIELHQGQTTVAAGADTQLDIPATAVHGDLIERVVQSRGNTFYSVAKRGAKKFRVETPYLVAVVKGTQFNVAVQDDAATVSLFEGRLEIRSADGSDSVDLQAGEIAVRRASDTRIRVLRMDTGEPVARSESSGGGGPAVARNSGDGAVATTASRSEGNATITPSSDPSTTSPNLADSIAIGNSAGTNDRISIQSVGDDIAAKADVGSTVGTVVGGLLGGIGGRRGRP